MRCVFIANYPIMSNRIGGMDYFFWELDAKMKESGDAVTWIFPRSNNHLHYDSKNLKILWTEPGNFLLKATGILETMRGETELVISCFNQYPSFINKAWNKLGIEKQLVIDHMSRPAKRSLLQRLKLRIKGIIYYRYIDRIIAISHFVKSSIADELGVQWAGKTSVVYNGIHEKFFHTNKSYHSGRFNITVIAHLIREKGIQNVITALAKLNDPEIVLNIAGDGNYKVELQKLVADLNLKEQVNFLGNITAQHELLAQSHISIIPSLWKEGFGLTVAESMATETATIGSNAGAIPELLANGSGIIYEAGNEEQLALAIKELKNNPQKVSSLGIQAKNRALEFFTIEKMVQNYVREIKTLCPPVE